MKLGLTAIYPQCVRVHWANAHSPQQQQRERGSPRQVSDKKTTRLLRTREQKYKNMRFILHDILATSEAERAMVLL